MHIFLTADTLSASQARRGEQNGRTNIHRYNIKIDIFYMEEMNWNEQMQIMANTNILFFYQVTSVSKKFVVNTVIIRY